MPTDCKQVGLTCVLDLTANYWVNVPEKIVERIEFTHDVYTITETEYQ